MFQVKSTRIITVIFAVFSMFILMAHLHPESATMGMNINKYYTQQLDVFKKSITSFKTSCQKKETTTDLKARFYQSRLTYKKLSVLTDYFNQYETKILNGPPIDHIESEVKDRIIPPQGFQAIEELLFSGKWSNSSYPEVINLLDQMLQIISKLENEPDRIYKFKDELVWDAVRSACVQLITTGITGFDSPAANYSLPEATASLAGIKTLLSFFKPLIEKNKVNSYVQLNALLDKSVSYLQRNNNFNEFDRLTFITQYINPFYKLLAQTRIESVIGIPGGRNSINFNSLSIFEADALNINFYSPPEEYWVTPERIRLGKLLFSDPILSGTRTRSCASCHLPEKAFTDGFAKPFALDGITLLARNTPTLYNSGFQTKQFFDSRADILENQLGDVVHNVEEMNGSLKNSVSELKKSDDYTKFFQAAYQSERDPINSFTIANAISCYVRSLQSLNSRFDKYMRGDYKQLSLAEKKGFNLFAGKAKCATCHFIPLFNGVVPPFFAETESEVLGVPKSKDKSMAELDSDPGKFNFTNSIVHKYAFKTPTLRNIALTAPYMHNGVYDTLEEVMEFYNNGGGKGLKIAPENQTLPFYKLNLSKNEITHIIAFMKALTDTSIIYTKYK